MDRFGTIAMLISKSFGAVVIGIVLDIPFTLQALALFVVIDFITGLGAACHSGKVDSTIGRNGVMTKAAMLATPMILGLGEGVLTTQIPQAAGVHLHLAAITSGLFLITEFISIIENLGHLGVPMPVMLIGWMVKLRSMMPETMNAEQIDAAFTVRDLRNVEKVVESKEAAQSLAAKVKENEGNENAH